MAPWAHFSPLDARFTIVLTQEEEVEEEITTEKELLGLLLFLWPPTYHGVVVGLPFPFALDGDAADFSTSTVATTVAPFSAVAAISTGHTFSSRIH